MPSVAWGDSVSSGAGRLGRLQEHYVSAGDHMSSLSSRGSLRRPAAHLQLQVPGPAGSKYYENESHASPVSPYSFPSSSSPQPHHQPHNYMAEPRSPHQQAATQDRAAAHYHNQQQQQYIKSSMKRPSSASPYAAGNGVSDYYGASQGSRLGQPPSSPTNSGATPPRSPSPSRYNTRSTRPEVAARTRDSTASLRGGSYGAGRPSSPAAASFDIRAKSVGRAPPSTYSYSQSRAGAAEQYFLTKDDMFDHQQQFRPAQVSFSGPPSSPVGGGGGDPGSVRSVASTSYSTAASGPLGHVVAWEQVTCTQAAKSALKSAGLPPAVGWLLSETMGVQHPRDMALLEEDDIYSLGLKPVEEKKLLSLVLSARQTWPPPPPGTPDLAVTDAFATMQAQESAALRAQRQSQQRAMFNQPAASYHADHVHVDVPPGAPLSPGAVQSIAYERHLAGVPSNLPVPDPNGARPLSHSSYHHAASTSTSGGSLYGGGAMYTNQHHGGHNNSSMAVARPATSMSLIGVGDPVMPTSVAPELSPSSPMQVPRVFARPKSAAGSVSGRTTPTQSTGTSSPGRERGGGFSGNHNHGGASSVSRRSGAPASGTSSPARSSRAARISTASAPSPLSYRPTSPSPSSVRRSGGFKGGSQGGVAASDMGEGFLRTYENDILGAITSDDGRDPNAPSSPATYRSDPYQNEYGSYADYPVAPGSPSVASTSAYTAVTGLTSASAMAGAGGNLLQAPDFMSLNSGDLQELNELLRSLVIKQRRVSSAAAGGGGGGAAGSPGSGRASRAGSSRTSSPVRNGYGPASVSGSVAGSRAGAAAAAAAGPACVHLGDVTFSGPIATRGSLGFEVLVVRAHNLVLCNGTLLLSPNQGVVFLGSNITLRNVRIVCAQPSDRHGRRVDRGMVHVAESGSVRMHACTLQQSIGHPALLVTDSAAVELHECDITARRGDAIWVQGAGASLVGCGCHVHDVQGGVAMVVYRGGRASLSRSSITGGGKFAAIEVSAKGSHVSLEGVTFADMESCSVHVLNRGTAQLRSCQLCSLRGYSLVVKGVASAAAVQDCCFVGGVDAASGYGGPTRVQGPESSSGVHVMHGGIVELLTTPGVIPGPRGLDMSPPLSGLMSGHHGTASVSSGGGGGGIVAGTRHSWAGQQQQQGQQMGGSAIRTHTAMRGGVGRVERTLVSSEGVFTP